MEWLILRQPSRCLVEVIQAVPALGVLLDGEGVDGDALRLYQVQGGPSSGSLPDSAGR